MRLAAGKTWETEEGGEHPHTCDPAAQLNPSARPWQCTQAASCSSENKRTPTGERTVEGGSGNRVPHSMEVINHRYTRHECSSENSPDSLESQKNTQV
jgi:hypothetical protein